MRMEGILDKAGAYVFRAPVAEYHVIFFGGDHHQVTLYSSSISK